MSTSTFYRKCGKWWWDGYYIPVRNSMNFRIEQQLLSEEEKIRYQKEFGETILWDHEFLDWYVNTKKLNLI